MLSSRPFARPVVIVWLLALALMLVGPASVYAKVEIVNGQDGAEGDPTDGADLHDGGGGFQDLFGGNSVEKSQSPRFAFVIDNSYFMIVPQYGATFTIVVVWDKEFVLKSGGAR